ncbi:uncharacterized protein L969DRAFT_93961 [Mixia osmundae IAM 14324]|uniref:Conserved oligomeric Golgi complex subunit 6 n=1 Tax=Mixia osmundae (strain CBS 9802 / IAM 14324 / JCM 22182 / KY 12970) TaxID=764103 RepID=G7E8N5_MIXOS|nr:uncharacterized protein L969DRAFT_93961 [Mixia osmundae IAM 14324]KEI40137.1 hypothetical protein L969DRAFT_93961 [Mixia osmundae IAM 14324]GAA99503.1 hypothetical protein E5Q_06203 [Mixia osmundae IAM 14324]
MMRSPASPTTAGGDVSIVGSSGGLSRNAIALKVSKILSTAYEDSAAIAALDTLAQCQLAPSTLSASNATNDTPAQTRTGQLSLRREVERRMQLESKKFLEAFAQVNSDLSSLQSHVDEMHSACSDVEQRLKSAHDSTRHLLEHADGLRQQRTITTQRQLLADVFTARFTLDDDELRLLNSREVNVGPSLFAVMDKVERIRQDCRVLMGGESGTSSQAGLDIMASSSQYLETAYQKIYKWCAFQVRGYASDVLEVSPRMKDAIRRLKARPDLLSEITDLLGQSRSTTVLNAFLAALTRGGLNGLPRPIEMHAHDPIRYVGDMLAWVHQATAGEREFLDSLFDTKSDGRKTGQARGELKPDDERGLDEVRIRNLLDRCLEGCGRPLRLRIKQTVDSQKGSIPAYQIANLITFYKITMDRTIGADALLSKTLTDINTEAYESFFETVDTQGRSLLRFIQPPSIDLSPPLSLRDTLVTLREIMQVYDSSLVDEQDRENEFRDVLDAALDPALMMCKEMGEMRPQPWDRAIFGLNCIGLVKESLEPFSFTSERIASLTKDQDKFVDILIDEHFTGLLKDSGLTVPHKAVVDSSEASLAKRCPASALITAAKVFDAFLTQLDTLSSNRLALLSSNLLASQIHRQALVKLAEAYKQIWLAVREADSGFEDTTTLLTRSPEDAANVLGV